MTSCIHKWVSNSGNGGEPVFKPMRGFLPSMHVKCKKCNSRTWYSEETWKALKEMKQATERSGG